MAKFSTLVDRFDQSGIDGFIWYPYNGPTQTDGRLIITSDSGSTTYKGLVTAQTFDLTGSRLFIQLVDAGVRTRASHQALFYAETSDGMNVVYWSLNQTTLTAFKRIANVDTAIATVPYNPVAHQWLSLEEQGGTTYWKTSPDGVSWTTLTSLTNPFALDTLKCEIVGGAYLTEAQAVTVKWDNLNVLAIAPPPTNWQAIGKEDGKKYLYHVSTSTGTFVGVWRDVIDSPEFTQALNTPGTTMTVQLGRSPNNRKEERSYLLSQAGDRITSEDGDAIVAVSQTPNNVGPGTDVVENYNVDVYVVYGQYDRLISQTNEYITSEAGEYIIVASGAPVGRRIFSGFVLDYETEYGDKNGVTVTLASHGYELGHQLVKGGTGDTTVIYSGSELGNTIKSVLDTNPGRITYDTSTISNTGVSPASMKFVVNTKQEAIKSVYDQTPESWYWLVDPADNKLYLKQRSPTADHTFVIGRDIKSLKVKKTIEALVNEVYFIGGEVTPGTPASTLFKRFPSSASLAAYPNRGLKRITDRRYTVVANAQRRADKDFSRFKDPVFTSPLVISSSVYDTESIRLGHVVAVRGFGNFLDTLAPLQIVRINRRSTEVALQLGELQEGQLDILADVQEGLENEQFIDLPNAPS